MVLDGVNFSVAAGETVALLGPSGSGKSVLLKHIIGLMRPDQGDVLVEGASVPALQRKELAALRTKIGYAFQTGALFDSMTVFENIRLGISDDHCYRDLGFCRSRVAECLQLVNLSEDVGRLMPAELSGGMRKRVGIARAIAGSPKYLLYDEPTSGLDPVNADAMDALIEGLQKQLHATSIVVSHDVRGSFKIADRIALLHNGRIRAVGTAEEFMAAKDTVVREFLERDIELCRGREALMELRYRREAVVGVFIIVAAAVFVLGMIWLRGKSLTSGERVEIVFSDVSGLKVGDPVRTSGVTVGQVQDIQLVSPGKVHVYLELTAAKAPRADARAVVRALDFFGARYVDYDPGIAAQFALRRPIRSRARASRTWASWWRAWRTRGARR